MSVTDGPAEPDPLARLIEAAAAGDGNAWGMLYARYTPLIFRICRRYRLIGVDAEDVSQVVWLGLFQHLKRLRERRALPGWIATTTRNEALRVVTARQRTVPADPMSFDGSDRFDSANSTDSAEPGERLDRADQRRALRQGLRQLPTEHRELLLLMLADPQPSYRDISNRLGIPIGSIGPTRARCLRRLRDTTEITALAAAA